MEDADQSPMTRVRQQGETRAGGSGHPSLGREHRLCHKSRHTSSGTGLEYVTCVISWETWRLCVPLAPILPWKHIFPRVNWHWKTINGSVVLQETQERAKEKQLPAPLGYTLIKRGMNGNITWKSIQFHVGILLHEAPQCQYAHSRVLITEGKLVSEDYLSYT